MSILFFRNAKLYHRTVDGGLPSAVTKAAIAISARVLEVHFGELSPSELDVSQLLDGCPNLGHISLTGSSQTQEGMDAVGRVMRRTPDSYLGRVTLCKQNGPLNYRQIMAGNIQRVDSFRCPRNENCCKGKAT
ncbi:MAG: hypothetical protein S4CHLAM81_06500 [Chlamydiales bacterium]|nr:hypothetical protein [Chlamydiales bacterium]MCH9635434.1 hypothetical protein [Chlamydiales bacterium]MCH9703631.1 hypothetical protein [Chlamydiota bacterium]